MDASGDRSAISPGLVNFFLFVASLSLVVVALVMARNLLIPFVVAVVLVYLINSFAHAIDSFLHERIRFSSVVSYGAAFSFLSLSLWLIWRLIAININQLTKVIPGYQHNLIQKYYTIAASFGFHTPPPIRDLLQNFDMTSFVSEVATSLAAVAGNAGIILVYMIFIFLEQKSLQSKIAVIASEPGDEESVRQLLKQINNGIRRYINIKTLTSVSTGVISYLILEFMGVDFAEFWGLVIFILNFIPTFGSIVATIFPSVLTLVQFESLVPFVTVVSLLTLTQFIIGSVIEPRLAGQSLGMSPLVILLSLAFWGSIWGFVGMIMCVPVMVIVIITLGRFQRTRKLAILLSQKVPDSIS